MINVYIVLIDVHLSDEEFKNGPSGLYPKKVMEEMGLIDLNDIV